MLKNDKSIASPSGQCVGSLIFHPMKPYPLFASVFLVLASGLSAKEPPPRQALADIDPIIEQALTTFQVPGLAVTVVVGDEVVLAKGYGFRDVEKKLPMTLEAQMPIASMTKKFMRTLWVANVAGGPFQYTATKPGSTPVGLEAAHRI